MKNRLLIVVSVLLISIFLSSCSADKAVREETSTATYDYSISQGDGIAPSDGSEESDDSSIEPDKAEILTVCQLATLKCYYHNVAVATKSKGSGISSLGEKDTDYWLEYTATAELGIDFTKVEVEIEGTTITVKMPEAEILNGIHVDSSSVGEPVCPPNTWYKNDVEITAADISDAMDKANDEIQEKIEGDSVLMFTARKRAEDLIRNYIDQIALLSGKDYTVKFESLKIATESEK